MTKCHGATRTVLLVGKYAIKFPSLYSWQMFLLGLLGNIQERRWWKTGWAEARLKLCPVLIADRWGFILIMPRCELLAGSPDEAAMSEQEHRAFTTLEAGGCLPVENKRSSFGYLNGRLVAVDFGS
jgi:hypothetical protein